MKEHAGLPKPIKEKRRRTWVDEHKEALAKFLGISIKELERRMRNE